MKRVVGILLLAVALIFIARGAIAQSGTRRGTDEARTLAKTTRGSRSRARRAGPPANSAAMPIAFTPADNPDTKAEAASVEHVSKRLPAREP